MKLICNILDIILLLCSGKYSIHTDSRSATSSSRETTAVIRLDNKEGWVLGMPGSFPVCIVSKRLFHGLNQPCTTR